MVLEKDSKDSKSKEKKYKSLALKAKKISSDEEASCSDSDDEEYAMAVRDFKNFFKRRGKFARQPHDDKRNFRRAKEEKKGKEERRCFKCGDPNHFISDCPKHSYNDQKAFVGGCWSDSEEDDDSKKDEIYLMAHDSNEATSKECKSCNDLFTKIDSLSSKLAKFKNSSHFLQEMLENQRLQKDKKGLGFTEDKASNSEVKTRKMGQENTKMPSVEPAHTVPSEKVPASANGGYRATDSTNEILKPVLQNKVCLKVKLELDEWIKDSGCSRHMMGNKDLFSTYEAINKGNVVFGSNTKSKIIDKGQICDKKCKVVFSKTGSEILKDEITIGREIRKNDLYVMKIEFIRIKESLNVRFDEGPSPKSSPLVDDDIIESQIIDKQIEKIEDKENEPLNKEIINNKESKDHPLETIMEKLNGRTLRSQIPLSSFSPPSTSPQLFFDSLKNLPPRTTNPPPPQPSFDSIKRLANQPPLLPEVMKPPLPPLSP
nr:retrovirus-related Pol polyprotein from transposon TNT 1-94 [Tanacetum cinerariifolium]